MPPNPQNLKPFKKGKGVDPRINRKGRKAPKTIDELSDFFRQWLAEPTAGKKMRLIGMMEKMEKRGLGQSKLLEYAYGKVPDKVEADVNLADNIIRIVVHGDGA